jgi:hypothetical protein
VIEEKFRALSSRLDEATLWLWAAVEARTLGHGGVSAVAKASGLSRTTIYAGLRELEAPMPRDEVWAGGSGHIRAKGGGRKKLTVKDPTLLSDLDALVTSTPWWNLRRAGIRNLRCAGPARVRRVWPRS